MGFGIDGPSGPNAPRQGQGRVKQAGGVAGQALGMTGDSLSLTKAGQSDLAKEVKAMTPEQADKATTTGGIMLGAGIFGVAAAYGGAGAAAAATGLALAPAVLGVGAAALAIFGAMKLGKGLSAKMSQLMESKTKGLDLGQ